MGLWIIFPICLSLVSFIGTWSYGLAFSNNHVCALTDGNGNYCRANHTDAGCCWVPTISSGTYPPENSLFTATINAGSFMFLFCIFHHAHIMERHSSQSMMSKFALVFGLIAAMGAFTAGNCNLHYLGAAISFMCACFYTAILTVLTGKCALSGYEKVLYPLRTISTVIQVIVTVITVLFAQSEYFYIHLSAVFEWMLSMNLELFELSYAVEFFFFSSYMLSNLLSKQDEV
uniref:Si:dkey-228d14.5 n=1 Tax=Neolamprologus brichardi TaxID=32507 RepID=A0A3Q4HTL6_NEOBR